MNPAEITFVVLTKNEAERLPRALASVPPGAPVLVLDAESTDATVTIANASGAHSIVRRWEGFSAARLFALAQVRTPWTFMLDADEALDERLRAAIAAAEPPPSVAGFALKRTTYLCGRPITGGGWGAEVLLRLFRTGAAQLTARPAAGGSADLHERWHAEGDVPLLDGSLSHDSYPTLASYWRKFHRYTSIEAGGARTTPLGVARVLGSAPLRALWLFAFRGGYRDGWRGVVVSFGSALYPVAVALKALGRR